MIVLLFLLYRLTITVAVKFPPIIEDSCHLKPPQCNLICTNGYQREGRSGCACACAVDSCQSKFCAIGEYCLVSGGVARCLQNFGIQRPDCPRVIVGGVCEFKCEKDTDCSAAQICCSNGCGRECVFPLPMSYSLNVNNAIQPVNVIPTLHHIVTVVGFQPTPSAIIKAVTNTTSLPVSLSSDKSSPFTMNSARNVKIGRCPPSGDERPCNTYLNCLHDGNCANVEKCCTNACGKVCVDPTTATNCIHLFVAVKKLPNKALKNNYVPKCDEHGKFDRIQCDQHQCWCVDVNNGTEIAGSAVPISMRRADMCREVRLCGVKCSKQCTYGLKMSVFGCPDPTCECRDICEGVRCNNDADLCQLIEPDCARPPCLPVPKCLLNPCPTSHIMTLPNGVTARCSTSVQCGNSHWCHEIGYNGYGFCCSGAEAQKRSACPSVRVLRNTSRCSSICRMDEDCVNGICCFDGCGLSCFSIDIPKILRKEMGSNRRLPHQSRDIVMKHNKGIISSHVADCPSSLERPLIDKLTECNLMCEFDNDCAGLRRCCRVGCSAQCFYPIRTTPCLNAALTAELYDMSSIRRCDQNGNFEQIQCDDGVCFCVDIANGEEIPGTRIANDTPNCKGPIRGSCPDIVCRTSCPYGMERSENGCLSCRCRNPCAPVRCPQGSLCIMAAVNCYEMDNCPPQPRCVLNLCPHGEPFVSQLGVVETCNSNEQCPPGYWCHQIGFSSSGLCCPSPLRLMHIGTCPFTLPQLNQVGDCRFDCRADDDCNIGEKCCYDGCGLRCKEVRASSGGLNGMGKVVTKPGMCPFFDERTCRKPPHKNQCSWDSECDGVQKCCSDGCGLKCLHPEENSVCLHIKAALQMIGQAARIQCRVDGSFEEIQCDADYCWCVNESGLEVEGTRSSEDTLPNCRAPRKCQIPSCTHDISCKFGMKKDVNGCDTCECSSPCDRVVCPAASVCVPMEVACIVRPCAEVPRCVVNPCLLASPLLNKSTAQFIKCAANEDCSEPNITAYCSHYKSDGGVCCPGHAPHWSPGTCPPSPASNADCSRHCVLDAQCPLGQKCCFNGCGLSCVVAVFAAPPPPPAVRIGECLNVKPLGAFCVQRTKESECIVDTDCPTLRKCCSDGCTQRCTVPYVTTHCIHAHLAALAIRDPDISVFVPECDSYGEHVQIQSHSGLRWCVDKFGREIPGTKSTHQPNCAMPRSCPIRACGKYCSLGFRTDKDGCPLCDCIAPCENFRCNAGFVCRIVKVQCYSEDCPPIPRCIPNTCPSGEPLIHWADQEAKHLVQCNEQTSCPAGYFCNWNGYEGRSFCCRDVDQQAPSITCPPTPLTTGAIDSSTCVVSCRRSNDCRHSVCCFNGCGMSCQFETAKFLAITFPSASARIQPSDVRPTLNIQPIHPVDSKKETGSVDDELLRIAVNRHPSRSVYKSLKVVDFASSPSHIASRQLLMFQKTAVAPVFAVLPPATYGLTKPGQMAVSQNLGMCPSMVLNPGCHEECLSDADCLAFAKCCKATCGSKCIEPAITTACMHRLAAFVRQQPHLPPPVQCEGNGGFREIQCHSRTRQCWCVDSSGIEVPGTRTNSDQGMPHCKHPKVCAVSCAKSNCSHGVRLDTNGCPRNGICQCNNPCEDFFCRSRKICVLVSVQCDRDPCPTIPKCVSIPCQFNHVVHDIHGNPLSCHLSTCPRGECVTTIGDDIGVCCQTLEVTMPANVIPKSYCTLYRAGVEELRRQGVDNVFQPACNNRTGLFSRIQCDGSGTCWCVDVESGRPLLGTRRSNAIGQNLCEAPRDCLHRCPRSLCPYGLLLDDDGCPILGCPCSSPCDNITCRPNKVCLLRITKCSTSSCLTMPACEKSPCSGGDRPFVDPRTKRQSSCATTGETCPTGFYCAGFDTSGIGVCCSRKTLLSSKIKTPSCPDGDPFADSSDGTPFTCSSEVDSCPSTHYCVTMRGEKVGVCCVLKNVTDGSLPPQMDKIQNAMETYELGFSLTGPQIPASERRRAQIALSEFLSEQFTLPASSIDDVTIVHDNTARFTVKHPHASAIAKNISEAVMSGLEINLVGYSYRVEPHTLFSHQLADVYSSNAPGAVFWVLFSIVMVFAVAVVIALFGVCTFMYRSSQNSRAGSSTERACSQLEFASHSIVGDRPQPRPQPRNRDNDSPQFQPTATLRSDRSIPQIPSISIGRPSTSYY